MAIIRDRQPAWPRRRRLWALAVLVMAPAVASFLPAAAQDQPQPRSKPKKDYALIFGTVFGPDSRARYGVPVKIRRADQKKTLWEGRSDHQGEFAARVPVGKADYIVWADIKTPKGEPKPQTVAHVENNERTDVGLHLKQ